jgi:hypothetical protein
MICHMYFLSFQNDGVNIINLKKTWEKVITTGIDSVIDSRQGIKKVGVNFYGNNKRVFHSCFLLMGCFFSSDD